MLSIRTTLWSFTDVIFERQVKGKQVEKGYLLYNETEILSRGKLRVISHSSVSQKLYLLYF